MANYFSGRVFVLCVGNFSFFDFQKTIFSAKSPTEEVAEAEASGEIPYEDGGEAEAEDEAKYTPEEAAAEANNEEEVEIQG